MAVDPTPDLAPAAPRRDWRPGIALGVGITVLGWSEVTNGWAYFGVWSVNGMFTVLIAAVAVVFYRHSPALALGGAWLSGAIHIVNYNSVLTVAQGLALMIICFGAARYGSRTVLWTSFLSVPAAVIATYVQFSLRGWRTLPDHVYLALDSLLGLPHSDSALMTATGVVGITLLLVPWLVGWALRARDRQATAEKERDLAESWARAAAENARLREDQARLARDVHDVVGHSLAVILAQAESAKFVPDDELVAIRETLDNVTDAARRSLQDVRQVLAGTSDASSASAVTADITSLLDSVHSSGLELDVREVGEPRSLPPDLEVVAYRVVQEMVTNVLKHATRDAPVRFSRDWNRELILSMSNEAAATVAADHADGMGLIWMRRRVEAAGGRLEITRVPLADADARQQHTVTVWLPLSGMEIST